mmetsp:Transcript_44741/g.66404  ORF Transcript_44741/g.66404 Transcript_44741/m.66404 type:complete len:127 (-) Transcript_44741:118-498(-)
MDFLLVKCQWHRRSRLVKENPPNSPINGYSLETKGYPVSSSGRFDGSTTKVVVRHPLRAYSSAELGCRQSKVITLKARCANDDRRTNDHVTTDHRRSSAIRYSTISSEFRRKSPKNHLRLTLHPQR